MNSPLYSSSTSLHSAINSDDPHECQGCLFLDLMKVTHAGEKEFNHAVEHVHDRGLRDELNKFARERRSIVAELTQLMTLSGEESSNKMESGSPPIRPHGTAQSEEDDQLILEEIERSEHISEKAYRQALASETMLPEAIHYGLSRLFQKVQRAHDRIRALRDSGIYHQSSHGA